jgi:hypothetical protein
MSAAETLFLALGLLLGTAAGAVLMLILRARPPAPREVRVTVTADAIPRRASTLAHGVMARDPDEPARGGPADRRIFRGDPPAGLPERRTSVLAPGAMSLALGAAGIGSVGARGINVHDDRGESERWWSGSRPDQPTVARGAVGVMERPAIAAMVETNEPTGSIGSTGSTGAADLAASGDPLSSDARARPDGGGGSGGQGAPGDPDGPCADQRRLSDERCEIAERARTQVETAEEALRAAQRDYDDHAARAVSASEAADPRAVRQAKDAAQAQFRTARGGADTTEDVEGAARDWLAEINRINNQARDAAADAAREQEAVRVLMVDLDRMAMDVESSRIAAETAEAACLAAREAVARCEEAAADEKAAADQSPTMPADTGGPEPSRSPLAAATSIGVGGTPRIFLLVRGDRAVMSEVVSAMAGDDPDLERRWRSALSDLVDAILADSIDAVSLEFPAEHAFWGPFTQEQGRDIARALASLGYRFDGLGGWVDERIPSQRDLSLALGYAGIDPMRIRHWPTEAESAALYAEVSVAADERLVGAAGDLTLGELVTMLGRRADGLADVWNDWGRLRPLLMQEV